MGTYHAEGDYRVKIADAKIATAKSGTQQVVLDLDLLEYHEKSQWIDPPFKGQYSPQVFLSLTEATLGTPTSPGWVTEVLKHLGFSGDPERLGDELCGVECEANCTYEARNDGKGDRESWRINRPRASAVPVERATLRKLKSTFAGLFTSTAPKAKPAPKPTAETTVPPDDNDAEQQQTPKSDIPF